MGDENEKREVVPDFEEPAAPGKVTGAQSQHPSANETVPGDDVPEAPDEFGHDPDEDSDEVDERLADDDDDDSVNIRPTDTPNE